MNPSGNKKQSNHGSIDVNPDTYDEALMKIEANASDGDLEFRGQQQYLQHNYLVRAEAGNNDQDPQIHLDMQAAET